MKSFKSCLWFFYYISWLYRYLMLILGRNALKDIKIISIEFASVCNLRCKFCFLEKRNRPKHLDINIYEKLLKEICESPKFNIKVMEWPISGEFFMHPDYKKIIEITRRYMEQYSNFRPHIILNENMVLMDEEKSDFILKSGVIKQIICSIDGHNAETFEDMRPPAKFDIVLRNFRILVRKNKEISHPVFIQVHNGRDEQSAGKELSEEMKEIFKMADYVSFWKPQDWNESFNKKSQRFCPAKGFCSFVFNNVTLTSSGKISRCCMDLKGSTEYADFSKDSLENIWHSRIRRQFLTLMLKNRRNLLKGCSTCSVTYTNNDNRYTNIFRTLKYKLYPLILGKEYYLKQVLQ